MAASWWWCLGASLAAGEQGMALMTRAAGSVGEDSGNNRWQRSSGGRNRAEWHPGLSADI